MKRIIDFSLFAAFALFTSSVVAQTSGVAELESVDDQTKLVAGFVANSDPSDGNWVVAEFEDCYGVVGYSDAFIDHTTGDVFSLTQLNFEGVNANSLSINLYSPNSSQAFGTIKVIDDPTEGSETEPTGTPDPNADPPDQGGASDDEQEVATIMVRLGYENVVNQPSDNENDWPNNDPDYQPPNGKYKGKEPDYRIQGELFDLYSPEDDTTPKNIADKIDKKAETQCDRVIVKLPDPPTGKTIDEVIDEIIDEVQKKRDTPDTGTRDDLEELIVVKPDGSIQRLFPNGGVN